MEKCISNIGLQWGASPGWSAIPGEGFSVGEELAVLHRQRGLCRTFRLFWKWCYTDAQQTGVSQVPLWGETEGNCPSSVLGGRGHCGWRHVWRSHLSSNIPLNSLGLGRPLPPLNQHYFSPFSYYSYHLFLKHTKHTYMLVILPLAFPFPEILFSHSVCWASGICHQE